MPPIRTLGEHALVERLRQRVGPPPASVLIGIGDDAAVLEPDRGTVQVLTTDGLVEDVHFTRAWTRPAAIGAKALAVNLSDLAAMGATPRASLLSLALPDAFDCAEFDELVDGYVSLAERSGATLVGGNLTRSPGPLMIDVTAVGAVARRRLLRRDTARVGDEIFVTGVLGAAAAGLEMLRSGIARMGVDDAAAACLARYESPEARTRCGVIVGRSRAASAAIDLSDGLADAVHRIAESAGAGVVLDAEQIPVAEGARAWASGRGIDPVMFAVAGGEDYELAFAVSPRRRGRFLGATRRCRNLQVTRIGRLVADRGAWLSTSGRLEPLPAGFVHF
jgi:thiamine-monophosphate kinase